MIFNSRSYFPRRPTQDSEWLRWVVFALVGALFLWPSYGEWKMAGVPNVAPPRMLKLMFFGLVALNFLVVGINFSRIKRRIEDNWIIFLCLFLFNFIQFATFASDSQGGYWVYQYIKEVLFGNLLVMFALLLVLRDEHDVNTLFKVLVFASLGVSLFSVAEALLKDNIFRHIVSDGNLGTAMAFTDKSRDMSYRVHSSFGHPLILAQYATCLLPIAVLLLKRARGAVWFLLLIIICGLVADSVLTSTRSGIGIMCLALAVTASFLFVDWWRTEKNEVLKVLVLLGAFTVLLLVVAAGIYWASQLLTGRTLSESQSSFARLDMVMAGVPKVLASPLTGYGPTTAIVGVGFSGMYINFIDNYFLLVALQSGLIASLLLAAVLVAPAMSAVSGFFNQNVYANKPLAAIGVSFGMFFVFQIIHASSDLFPLFYMLIACFAVLNSSDSARSTDGSLLNKNVAAR